MKLVFSQKEAVLGVKKRVCRHKERLFLLEKEAI